MTCFAITRRRRFAVVPNPRALKHLRALDQNFGTRRARFRMGRNSTVASMALPELRQCPGSVPFQTAHTSAFNFVRIGMLTERGMSKSEVVGDTPRKHGRRRPGQFPTAVEGQIAEICRDLAVETKRMRQLQEQADELLRVIRQWAGQATRPATTRLIVENDTE